MEHLCDRGQTCDAKSVMKLTVIQRCREIAVKPSTSRRREASVKDISGVKTEHKTCAHPWPSVGLQARRKESGGEHGGSFSSADARGQSKQSGF